MSDDAVSRPLRSAWVMLLLMALHSQLEYPLWYAYFLLPTAWLFGYGLGAPALGPDRGRAARPASATRALFVGGLLLVLGSALALVDYARVAVIFMPPQDGTPLAERIAAGRRSWLFAHHADYAAVTTDDDPSTAEPGLRGGAALPDGHPLDDRLGQGAGARG